MIFKISPKSGGRAPQTPHLIPYYEYSIRFPRVCLHARNLRALKIGRFGQFEVRFGQCGWFAPLWKFPRTPMCVGRGAVWNIIQAICSNSTQIARIHWWFSKCLLILGGEPGAPQTPHLISFYEYSIRNPAGECLSARILHALKIGRFVHFGLFAKCRGRSVRT